MSAIRSYLARGDGDTRVVDLKGGILLLAALAALVSIAVLPSSNAARAQETGIASRPTNLRAAATGSGIILTWGAPSEGDVAGYRIARVWLDDRGIEQLTRVVDTHSADTTYTDVRIDPSVLYLYYVRAVFNNGRMGDWSRGVSVRALSSLPGIPPPVYIWRVVYGELPPGLFLNESTGEFYGTPGEVGRYNVVVERQRVYPESDGQLVSGEREQ